MKAAGVLRSVGAYSFVGERLAALQAGCEAEGTGRTERGDSGDHISACPVGMRCQHQAQKAKAPGVRVRRPDLPVPTDQSAVES